jgi:hypothetical protein
MNDNRFVPPYVAPLADEWSFQMDNIGRWFDRGLDLEMIVSHVHTERAAA